MTVNYEALADRAAEVAREHDQTYLAAEHKRRRAWAEVARLQLLGVVAEFPWIIGFTYEVEYVYDDEGAYFPSTEVRVSEQFHEDADYADEALLNLGLGFDELSLLFGGDEREGETTIEKLSREVAA